MMPTRLFFLLCIGYLAFGASPATAQSKLNVYWVQFKDKKNSPYSVLRPQELLSPRAIARRRALGIPIDMRDVPVSPAYVEALGAYEGGVHYTSRWMNGAVIFLKKKEDLAQIQALPFVEEAFGIGKHRKVSPIKPLKARSRKKSYRKRKNYYGGAAQQTEMLALPAVHEWGYKGQDMHVAIFDGGFQNVPRMPAFDSLFATHRILGTHDFVEGDEYVYESSSHGTYVLSTMAAQLPYLVVGTGPAAAYYLFKTEDTGGEFWIEEYNWLAAAERADSLGVDVINSSLGYTVFNDKSMSYTYKDLDGQTAVITRAADIAAEKGLLVVTSAGNEGRGPWHFIGAPADAQHAFTVGATDYRGNRAVFSSLGPTSDGRLKPNVAARGRKATVAQMNGYDLMTIDGTSFSAPILAGAVVALWSAFPERSNFELMRAIEETASQATRPDYELGFGVPDFSATYKKLRGSVVVLNATQCTYHVAHTVQTSLDIIFEQAEPFTWTLTHSNGLLVDTQYQHPRGHIGAYRFTPPLSSLQSGSYILSLQTATQHYLLFFTK